MKKKIKRLQVRDLKSLDGAQAYALEMQFDRVGGHIFPEQWIEFRFPRNQPDVSRIPFIARAGVRDLKQLKFQTSSTTTSASTASFGINAGQ